MKFAVTFLSEFRRRRAQERGLPAPARVRFEQTRPIHVPLRTRQTEHTQIVLKIRDGHSEGIDAEQAIELGQALIDAAASTYRREGP